MSDTDSSEVAPDNIPLPDPINEIIRRPIILDRILDCIGQRDLLRCMRVSKLFNALVVARPDKCFAAVTLSGRRIESVFEGIDWERVDTMKGGGGGGGDLSIVGNEQEDTGCKDNSHCTDDSCLMLPSNVTDLNDAHTRKVARLAHCPTLTIHGHEYRHWSSGAEHRCLANLMTSVRTCRVVYDIKHIDEKDWFCHSVQSRLGHPQICPWAEGLRLNKVVYRSLGNSHPPESATFYSNAADPLYVFFVPPAGEYRDWIPLFPRFSGGLPSWIASHTPGRKKIIFAPPQTSSRAFAEVICPADRAEPPLTLDEVKQLLVRATSEGVTPVIGLERVRVVDSLDSRNWWITHPDDWAIHYHYIPTQQVMEEVVDMAKCLQPRDGPHYQFLTVEEYVASAPNDELYDDELDPNSVLSRKGWNWFVPDGDKLRAGARSRWARRGKFKA